MSDGTGRPITKMKTKDFGELVDFNPHPKQEKYAHGKMLQKGYERNERTHGSTGTPHKSGHGGKFTWEGPDDITDYLTDPPPAALDEHDPNYVDDDAERKDSAAASVVSDTAPALAPSGVARVAVVHEHEREGDRQRQLQSQH